MVSTLYTEINHIKDKKLMNNVQVTQYRDEIVKRGALVVYDKALLNDLLSPGNK